MAPFGRKPVKQTETIDLRQALPEPQKFGYPTPCPACGGNGYLDGIDLAEKVMYQHCPSCFTKWATSEQELAERS